MNIKRLFFICLSACGVMLQATPATIAFHKLDGDLSAGMTFPAPVSHPSAVLHKEDLARVRENILRNQNVAAWAGDYLNSATQIAARITPDYVVHMISRITPGSLSPCPACRDKGLRWVPHNGWKWTEDRPDEIECPQCKTVFPNDKYPETKVLRSTYDPVQTFTFFNVPEFDCFGLPCPANASGIIRSFKLRQMFNHLATLGYAYSMSPESVYAEAGRLILLRLAEVMPHYLVIAGGAYSEFGDCDPHVAARNAWNLPNDELVLPPNKPNRRFHAGYWSTTRLGNGGGMDGSSASRIAVAYDLLCDARRPDGTAVFTAAERARIEKDLLIEMAYLLVADERINNKTVANRAGAAMIGLVTGHADLVRFGLDGFVKTVGSWFLPDGTSSESATYAMQTMGGLLPFVQAIRDYTDPDGYVPPEGSERLVHWNAVRSTSYGLCWRNLYMMLQGDINFPPINDTNSNGRSTIGIGFHCHEALGLPEIPWRAIARRRFGDTQGICIATAFFCNYAQPDGAADELLMADAVFPYLGHCYFRSGADGRTSFAALNADNWGGHHHLDSLGIYYWKDGHELLTDLGYMWDHPDKPMNEATQTHHTLVVDHSNQIRDNRGGSIGQAAFTPEVKMVQASSQAYGPNVQYARRLLQIDHGDGNSYLVDFFNAGGGTVRELAMHGPNTGMSLNGIAMDKTTEDEGGFVFSPGFNMNDTGTLDIRAAEVRRLLPDGTEGPNLMPPFPETTPADELIPGWGLYRGSGKGDWKALPGGGVRLEAREKVNGNMNLSIRFGKCNGYSGGEAFRGKPGERFIIRLQYKSSRYLRSGMLLWPEEQANVPAARKYPSFAEAKEGEPDADGFRTWQAVFNVPRHHLDLDVIGKGSSANAWSASWKLKDDYTFSMHVPADPTETLLFGNGWGQRYFDNRDRGTRLSYVFRRKNTKGPDCFGTVYEGNPAGKTFVRRVSARPIAGNGLLMIVETVRGTDLILHNPSGTNVQFQDLKLSCNATAAAVMNAGTAAERAVMLGGTTLKTARTALSSPVAEYSGKILGKENATARSAFILEGTRPAAMNGPWPSALIVRTTDGKDHAYPIQALEDMGNGRFRAVTQDGLCGFPAVDGVSWRLPVLNRSNLIK